MRAYINNNQVYVSCCNRKTGETFALPLNSIKPQFEFMLIDALFDLECKLISLIKDKTPNANAQRVKYEFLFNAILAEAMSRGYYKEKYNSITKRYE